MTSAPHPQQHHLKKLESRRLDFDYKKKRQGRIPDEELRQAMEKFEESKEVSETSMHNLLETDVRAPAPGLHPVGASETRGPAAGQPVQGRGTQGARAAGGPAAAHRGFGVSLRPFTFLWLWLEGQADGEGTRPPCPEQPGKPPCGRWPGNGPRAPPSSPGWPLVG